MKICSRCKVEKPLEEFYKNKAQRLGVGNQCKSCERYAKAKAKFGLEPEQLDELYRRQNNSCFICERPESELTMKMAIDHDHKTGEVRGLLCNFCNRRVIGRHRDAARFRRAAEYLEQGTGWIIPNKKPKKRKKRSRKT